MAIRQTRFQIKNNPNSLAPFSGATLLAGEPIVNTAAGIMMFSGVTTGPTADWVSAGDGAANSGGNNNFFEVGSNLYNLKIRNKITSYGSGSLAGKFLSGTTNGFELANISQITGVNTYVTGFTYTSSTNTIYLRQNNGEVEKPIYIDSFSGLTINGILSGITSNFTNSNIGTLDVSGGTITSLTASTASLTNGTITTNATNPTDIVNYKTLTGYSSTSDTYVTGGTITQQPSNTSISGTVQLSYNKTVGSTYTLPYTDVFVTGFTYDSASNAFTLKDNSGNTFTKEFTIVSGLTVNNLVDGQVVYVGTNKLLKSDSDFTFNENENKLSVTNLTVNNANSAATFGNGGVIIGSGGSYETSGTGNLTVHGSLTVFGQSISAYTSELYIEDKNIILNYNPTGSSQSTSVGAGITIQNGQGTGNGDVAFQLASLNTLTGNTGNPNPSEPYSTEYTSGDGYNNRGWVTQLNDIVIRSENINTPRGVRVLAEFDVLDGGQY